MGINCSTLFWWAVCVLYCVLITSLVAKNNDFELHRVCKRINEDGNNVFYFQANVCTGAVNLMMRTIYAEPHVAYSVVCCVCVLLRCAVLRAFWLESWQQTYLMYISYMIVQLSLYLAVPPVILVLWVAFRANHAHSLRAVADKLSKSHAHQY